MGKLVRFEKRQVGDKPRKPGSAEGEVVIFTGVRYERGGTASPGKPPASAGSKRKRG